MKNTVIIKGNRYGISIVLNDNIPFDALLLELESKLEAAEEFFDCEKQLAVSFEGRELSNEELDMILSIIQNNSKLNISYVMDENSELETTFFDIIQTAKEEEANQDTKESDKETLDETAGKKVSLQENTDESSGLFYKGTLHSGQIFEAKQSVIIVGDVCAGATVIAGGNVVVIGAIKGSVNAGCNGDKNAFIMGLSMDPSSLEIDGIAAKETTLKRAAKNRKESLIAIVIDKQISIDPISKSAIHDFCF